MGTRAVVRNDESDEQAVYKDVAIADNKLYVTDFHNGEVEAYDSNYAEVETDGEFADRRIPNGYAPFNIMAHEGLLYVTYAKQELPDKVDDDPGAERGFVDVFDTDGHLVDRLIRHGALNSPWGLAIAPS